MTSSATTEKRIHAQRMLDHLSSEKAVKPHWKSFKSAPKDGTKFNAWMAWGASPLTFGWSDEFEVPAVWFDGTKWVHQFRGKPEQLRAEYLRWWRPLDTSVQEPCS